MVKASFIELSAPGVLEVRTQDLDDKNLAPTEVLATTEYSVISTGTEIAAWLGAPPLRPSTPYPRLVGYCNLARVEGVGKDVKEIKVGDRILTHQSHRSAFICDEKEVLLRPTDTDTAFRKKIAALYLYHLGYDALLKGDYRPGHEVGIVGLGVLGISTAQLLHAFGTQGFLFSHQNPQTFSKVISSGLILPKDKSSANGLTLVVNTSNEWRDYLLSLQVLGKGGQLVCLGFPGRGQPAPDFNPLDSQYFYEKQLQIKHCGYTPDVAKKRNLRFLSQLVAQNRIDPLTLLSIEAPWTELKSVYEALSKRKEGQYTALIQWQA